MTLAYRAINAAKVQAFEDPIVRSPDGFRGGPVLEDATDAPLRHPRDGRPFDSFPAGAEYTVRLEGEHVYAGPIHNHFGHFMSEMVRRVLPAKRLGLKSPFLFVTTAGGGHRIGPTATSRVSPRRFWPSWRSALGTCGWCQRTQWSDCSMSWRPGPTWAAGRSPATWMRCARSQPAA